MKRLLLSVLLLVACKPVAQDSGTKGLNVTGPAVHHEIKNRMDGKCIEAQNNQKSNGTPIVVTECNGSASQQWEYVNLWNNVLMLKLAGSTHCLDLAQGNTAAWASYHLWTCERDNLNQRFVFEGNGAIKNEKSGRYLHSGKNGRLESGGTPRAEGDQQRWHY